MNLESYSKEDAFLRAHMIDHMSNSFDASDVAISKAANLLVKQGEIDPNKAIKTLYANKNMAKKLVDILKRHIDEKKVEDESENAEKVDEMIYSHHNTKPLEVHSPWREPVGNFPHSTFNLPEGAAVGPSIYQ